MKPFYYQHFISQKPLNDSGGTPMPRSKPLGADFGLQPAQWGAIITARVIAVSCKNCDEGPGRADAVGDQMEIDVLGYSAFAVDDVYEIASFPHPGAKTHIRRVGRFGGGQCAMALAAAARLGMNCYFGGVLGRNELSDFAREVLRNEGIVFAEHPDRPDARPYHSIVLVDADTGERTILADADGVHRIGPEDVDPQWVARSRVLLVDHTGPQGTLRACQLAKSMGVPIVSDLERFDDEAVREAARISDHLIMSASGAFQLCGKADPAGAAVALAATPRALTAVTAGADGCWFVAGGSPGELRHQPAFEVTARNTTGCGDVFHGAYAACLVWGMMPAAAIAFASAAAAIKATGGAGPAGIADRATVERFLRERGSASGIVA
jgi:sugar/nucleoside kinase (ribokinase family)